MQYVTTARDIICQIISQ